MYPTAAFAVRAYDRERKTFDSLIIGLAEECYRREHAGKSPKTLGELVGPYLKRLPEGFDPSDAAFGEMEKSMKK